MDVKTVFKVLIGTVLIIGLATFVTELYNASVNSALLRQKIDSAAESSLNYFNQESFRDDGGNSTVNLPNFVAASDPLNVYVTGNFYTHADNPIQQDLEMFNWYPGATESKGYDASLALPIYAISMMDAGSNNSYNYSAVVGGENLGFRIHCKRLPRMFTNLSPYNYTVPATAQTFTSYYSDYPRQYFGVANRYTEDINEVSRWGTSPSNPNDPVGAMHNYSDIKNLINSLHASTTGGNNQYISGDDLELWYGLGALNSYAHLKDAVENGYSPANVGFPMFSWQLNRMFRWHLCSSLTGTAGFTEADANHYVSDAIDVAENGAMCVKWNGFDVFVDQARITDINYYVYNLYDSTDLNDFCERASMDVSNVEALKKFSTPGYSGLTYANTVVDADGNPFSFAMIVDIKYTVPVAYRGITPFRQVINWITEDTKAGYAGFRAENVDPTASGIAPATYATTNMSGELGDDAFMVDSALEYVVMP